MKTKIPHETKESIYSNNSQEGEGGMEVVDKSSEYTPQRKPSVPDTNSQKKESKK